MRVSIQFFPGVSSCRDVLTEELGKDDGEYALQLNPTCQIPVRVYCHGMNTSEPKEYLTLPRGTKNNYAIVYAKRLPANPVSMRYRCDGVPGKRDYSKAGVTRFEKVRLDVKKMTVITDDYTFASIQSGESPSSSVKRVIASQRTEEDVEREALRSILPIQEYMWIVR